MTNTRDRLNRGRTIRRAVGMTLVAVLLGSCSDGTASNDQREDEAADPAAALALACTKRINDRTGITSSGSGRATLAIVAATRSGKTITPAESKAAVTELRSQRKDVDDTVKALTPTATHVDGATTWLKGWQDTTRIKEQRINALESGDQAEVTKVFTATLGKDVADGPPAAGRYDLARRDCARVFTALNPASIDRDFTSVAATSCTTIANRRAAGDFAAATKGEFALVVSMSGLTSTATASTTAGAPGGGGDRETVKTVLAERDQTVTDLAKVDAPASHRADWTDFVRSQQTLRDRTNRRVEALDPPDAAKMKATLGTPNSDTTAATQALRRLGLDRRDCGVLN